MVVMTIALVIAIGGCAETSVHETPAVSSANAQGVQIIGNTEINAKRENSSAVSKGEGNTAKNTAGAITRNRTKAIVFNALESEALRSNTVHALLATPGSSSSGSKSILAKSLSPARHPSATQADGRNTKLENYSVVVAADRQIKVPGPPGEMRVWIGNPLIKPLITGDMHSGETILPALSDTAKITPFTPGMEVLPKESVCEKIHPTGSEVRFQLKPSAKGTYKVGADVALYTTSDCSGRPIPKATSTVQVEVTVDMIAKIEQHGDEVAAETWKAFLEFWGKVAALIFALFLFLLRKRLFKLFGIKQDEKGIT